MSELPEDIVLLGGPGTGKSQFLGSLATQADAVERPYIAYDLGENATGWREAKEPILGRQKPPETQKPRRLQFRVSTRSPLPAGERQVTITDYPGSRLDDVLSGREQPEDSLWDAWRAADRLCLFCSPGRSVLGVQRPTGVIDNGTDQDPFSASNVYGPGVWERSRAGVDRGRPAHIPPVFSLVEILQILRERRGLAFGERPSPGAMRVAIIITAWDTVEGALSPHEWLEAERPMLADFLWSNLAAADILYAGVSVPLPAKERPLAESWRVTVQHPADEPRASRDLWLPLLWLWFGADALDLVIE